MTTAWLEHLRLEWRAALRNPSILLMAWLFPLGFALVIGAVLPALNPAFKAGMVSAFALIAVMTGTILGLPGPMVEARTSGVLRGFRDLGVPDRAAVGIPGLAAVLHAVPSALLSGGVALLLSGGAWPASPLGFVATLVLAAVVFASLGTLMGVVATSSRATVLSSQVVFLPSMMLGGMMIPFEALPAAFRPLSLALPTTHVMQLFAGLADGRATVLPVGWHVLALALTGALAWGLSVALFETEPREMKAARGLWLLVALAPLALSAVLL